jgi:biotin synthase-like enzyme
LFGERKKSLYLSILINVSFIKIEMCQYCEMLEYLDAKLSIVGSRTSERLSDEAKRIIIETITSVSCSPNWKKEHAGMLLMGFKYGYNQGLKERSWRNATIEQ